MRNKVKKSFLFLFVIISIVIIPSLVQFIFYKQEEYKYLLTDNIEQLKQCQFNLNQVKQIRQNDITPPADEQQPQTFITNIHLKLENKVRRLPQALIIGNQKCGTQAVVEFMKSHPLVVAPSNEIFFFNNDYDIHLFSGDYEFYR
jgi:hypothetical protein